MKGLVKMNTAISTLVETPVRAVSVWVRDINPYDPNRLCGGELEPIRVEEIRIHRMTSRLLITGFAAFMLWAVFAPLDAGVNVAGTVVVQGNRKTIQHPSGGVVDEILVHEGDVVKKGDVLIKLNKLNTEASLNSAELDYINAIANESRLISEREGLSSIEWLPQLNGHDDDPRVVQAKQQQTHLFLSRRAEFIGQQKILEEQISGFSIQGKELAKVIQARKAQLAVMGEEVKNNRALAAEGFVSRSRANEIERSRSDLIASLANSMSELGKAQSSLAAARLQLNQAMTVYRRDIDARLADVQKQREALRAKVESLKFDSSLTELRAPVPGTVTGMKVHTVGGVIQSGSVLMEIVPAGDSLIVEAQIPPDLIDKVKVGLNADMRFTAFNRTTTPVIPGVVRMVGADRMPADATDSSHAYYLAKIATTKEGDRLLAKNQIQPGMPVDVIIKTGERTFLSYLFKPLSDRFAQSFKEN